MKWLLIIILIFPTVFNAQIKQLTNGTDTAFWYSLKVKTCDKVKLPRLINCADRFHFRFWTIGQAIDVWTNDYKTFHGLITNIIYEYKEKEGASLTPIFSSIEMDTLQARQVYELTAIIDTIPSDKYIKKWVQGNDGVEYIFETSTPEKYFFKTYWTPDIQPVNLIEAMKIQWFVDRFHGLNFQSELNIFFSKNTKHGHSYMEDGGFGVSTLITKKQRRKTERYNRNH